MPIRKSFSQSRYFQTGSVSSRFTSMLKNSGAVHSSGNAGALMPACCHLSMLSNPQRQGSDSHCAVSSSKNKMLPPPVRSQLHHSGIAATCDDPNHVHQLFSDNHRSDPHAHSGSVRGRPGSYCYLIDSQYPQPTLTSSGYGIPNISAETRNKGAMKSAGSSYSSSHRYTTWTVFLLLFFQVINAWTHLKIISIDSACMRSKLTSHASN